MKPGGCAIIQVPFFEPVPDQTFEDPSITSSSERFKKYGQKDHLRLYGKDYKQRLERCGFQVKEEELVKQLPPETVSKFALVNETIYHCIKP